MIEDGKNPKEAYADWEAPKTAQSEAEIRRKVAERKKQTFSSRLCEYLLGMKPEDPRILERLRADQEIVRSKYDLPSRSLSAYEFERALMQRAQGLGVKIKSKSECGKFFEENPFAGAAYFEEEQIGADIDRADSKRYISSLNTLEHELVHAIQHRKSQRMPTELMEYEAYVSGANLEFFRKHPKEVNDIFFNFFVGGSVDVGYRLKSEKRGEIVSPEWDNPEYFLRRDGIDAAKLRPKAKRKHKK